MILKIQNFWLIALLVVCFGFLSCTDAGAQDGQSYEPDWQSLSQHQEVPEWVRDTKFGIYVHWGVYSVPAYNNEHYYSHMHDTSEYAKLGTHKRHKAVYGPLSEFGYHDFIPRFKKELFDGQEWAELYIKGGARFAGMVAEHHDGFAMRDSKWTPFDAKDMGPERDIVGEFSRELKDKGIRFFASLYHSLNYTYVEPEPEWEFSDPNEPRDRNNPAADGYTMLEKYLNSLVDSNLTD